MRPRQIMRRRWPPRIGSGGPDVSRRRPVRLLALLQARDEIAYLPGYVANVSAQVDGIVALDDGSTDGSVDFLASRPEVIELLRVPPARPVWDEPGNHRALVGAALRHGAEWLVSVDADERLEREFGVRAQRVIRRGRLLGLSGYSVQIRSLWNSHDAVRMDGDWAHRFVPRLFFARADHRFDDRPLHAIKAPLQARVRGRWPSADLAIYHLRMVEPAARAARRARYERLDPTNRWQPGLGYAYLTDEAALRLSPIELRRGYVE